jgi:hypothetical protein
LLFRLSLIGPHCSSSSDSQSDSHKASGSHTGRFRWAGAIRRFLGPCLAKLWGDVQGLQGVPTASHPQLPPPPGVSFEPPQPGPMPPIEDDPATGSGALVERPPPSRPQDRDCYCRRCYVKHVLCNSGLRGWSRNQASVSGRTHLGLGRRIGSTPIFLERYV